MPEYECPNCHGGFNDADACPWCGQPMDGSVDPPYGHTLSRVEDSTETMTLGEKLLGGED